MRTNFSELIERVSREFECRFYKDLIEHGRRQVCEQYGIEMTLEQYGKFLDYMWEEFKTDGTKVILDFE